jgi:hypothetical protein
MTLPPKAKLIKKIKRDKFFQSFFNILIIIFTLNIVYTFYNEYSNDKIDVFMVFYTILVLIGVYLYAMYANNRIRKVIYETKELINSYEKVEQIIEMMNDTLNDGGKK